MLKSSWGQVTSIFACVAGGLACHSRGGLTAYGDGGQDAAAGGSGFAGAGEGAGSAGAGLDARPDDGGLPVTFDPGSLDMRRLSAVEYTHTLQDLLGLADIDTSRVGALLDPGFSRGVATFDDLADDAPVSPSLFEAHYTTAVVLVQQTFASDALRARIVTCAPTSAAAWETCARDILKAFGLRAWRRPLTEGELTDLVAVVRADLMEGDPFTDALQQALVAMLASESFLYRIELDPPADVSVHPLTSYELASRLSYLLWSTMPDDALFALAATDELQQTDTLTAQVTRMLADPRSDGFVRNFFGQWLGFRRLDGPVLTRLTVNWSFELQASAADEARLFVSELVHGDQGIGALLTADVSFVDAGLAQLYKLPVPATAPPGQLTRTVVTTDARKGYLGLAAFLALEAADDEQSRFARGLMITTALLCAPVPPPPPNHPPNPSLGTPQQQYAELAATPACGACHKLFEPLGLGLESFDEIGQFRASYADGSVVDATGALPDGTPFEGLSTLADLLGRDQRVRDCARRQALVYALGRPLTSADEARLPAIDTRWNAAGNTVRGLLGAIVVDGIFRYRRGEARP
jgi:hypothetical protein